MGRRNLGQNTHLALLGILICLIFIRLFEPRSRERSYFLSITGVHIGEVIPIVALVLVLILVISKRFRLILGGQIPEIFSTHTWSRQRNSLFKTYFWSLPLLSVALFLIFKRTFSYLLPGVDGDYIFSLARNQVLLEQSPFFFNSNLLHGVSENIYFPINFVLDPAGYILGSSTTQNGIILSHVVWSITLYSSIFYLASSLTLKPHITLFASLFSTYLLAIPSVLQWTPILFQIPYIFMVISISNILIGRTFNYRSTDSFIRSFLINALIVLYFVSYAPLWIMVFLPVIAVSISVKFCLLTTQKLRFVLVNILPWILIFLLGAGIYLVGLYLSSSTFTFTSEFLMPELYLKHASLVFRAIPNAALIILSIIICVAALKYMRFSKKLLVPYWTVIIFYSFLSILGFYFYLTRNSFVGPPPIYSEFSVLPLVGILTGSLFITFCHSALLYYIPALSNFLARSSTWLVPACIFMLLLHTYNLPTATRSWEFPPKNQIQTSLTEFSIYPENSEFKGRVATFTGMKLPPSISHPELQEYNYSLLKKYGDDFRHSGLWFNGIPTLSEYSPVISVWNYALNKKYFFATGDLSYRNVLVKRRINFDQLRLLGVSRIITDTELTSLGRPIVTLKKDGQRIYLYRLENSNISGILFNTRKELESFFLTNSVLKNSAASPKITRVGSGLRIEFKNIGERYLLLPLEFSRCIHSESKNKVEIFRAQEFLIGVKFENNLSLDLDFRYGIFTNSYCKIQDYLDFRKFYKINSSASSR